MRTWMKVLTALVGTMALISSSGCGTRQSRAQIIGALSAPTAARAAEPGSDPATSGEQQTETTSSPDAAQNAAGSSASAGRDSSAPAANAPATPTPGAVVPATGAGRASGTSSKTSPAAASPGRPADPAKPGAGPVPKAPTAPAGACTGPGTLPPVTIGNIGEYSGPAGAIFASGQRATRVAVRWLNDRCGLNGHPIRLVSADGQADPARYQALAKDMVENQGAVAFLNNFVALSGQGADAYLKEKQIPVIGGDGANPVWHTNPFMFFPGSNARDMVLGGAKYAVTTGSEKIADFYCGEAQICRFFHEILSAPETARTTGIELVYSAQISLAQPDFTSECLQAKSRGAEAIFLGTDSNTAARIGRSCRQQGYAPRLFAASVQVVDSQASEPALDGMVGYILSFPWFLKESPAQAEFHQAIAKYDPGHTLSVSSAEAWVGAQLLREAGARLPASNPRPNDLLDGLYTIKGNDLGGLTVPVTYSRGAPNNAAQPPCVWIVEVKQGKWTTPIGTKPTCL